MWNAECGMRERFPAAICTAGVKAIRGMKLRLVGTVYRLNVEHRTPNIERPILMTLRFIYFKTSQPRRRRNLKTQNFEGKIRFAQSFFFIDRIHYSMLDVQCSMFDVHFLINPFQPLE
jgi:hypothetical protein